MSANFIRGILAAIGDMDESAFLDKYGYIDGVINRIPTYSCIDQNVAKELAAMSLAGANICSDLIGELTQRYQILNIAAKEEEGKAGLLRSRKVSTTAQKFFAQTDKDFVDAMTKKVNAETMLEALKRKYDVLMALHYLSRDIIKGLSKGPTAEAYDSVLDDLSFKGL